MSWLDDDEVWAARSSFSQSTTRQPRPARSRAMPQPLIPPPTISTSQSAAKAEGGEATALKGAAPFQGCLLRDSRLFLFRIFSFWFLNARFSSALTLNALRFL